MTKYVVDYDRLLPGDIVLTAAREVPSKMIRAATASKYSHAAIWVGGSLIEATLEGVFSANPQRMQFDEIGQASIFRRRVPLTAGEAKLICTYARSKIGTLYALSELSLLPLGRYKKLGMLATKRQFCSRLVAMAYEYGGCSLSQRISAEFCTPRMISLSKILVGVPDMVREALPQELEIAASPNPVRRNQEQLFRWLNGIREVVENSSELSAQFDIQSESDAYDLLAQHPELDAQATDLLRSSGYLSFYNHDQKVPRLAYRYGKAAMISLLSSVDDP